MDLNHLKEKTLLTIVHQIHRLKIIHKHRRPSDIKQALRPSPHSSILSHGLDHPDLTKNLISQKINHFYRR